ncbi:MAG: hydrogenase maturation nickel metallochaperone HypA [Planctomycetes bacterium]|nr:hydrogenase maturation nickel metallochaperone HypA [Planctomycetota bacterium]
MHELSIVEGLLKLVLADRAERGPSDRAVRAVRVAIGELASVEPTQLAHAWQSVASEHGELVVEWCRARQVCATCGEVPERQPGSWLRLCPACGDPLRVEGGDELDLVEIEYANENGALRC